MKKMFYSMFALAAMAMTSTSCQDEIDNGGMNKNEAVACFKLQLENAVGSRAIGDGGTAKYLTFAVFKAENGVIGDEVEDLRQYDIEVNNLEANVETRLVKGQTYNFVFWAQAEKVENKDGEGTYYDISDMSKIKVQYKSNNEIDGNQESRDAFYAIRKDLKVTGPITETITLKRPFGQINVGTQIGSLKDAHTAESKISRSRIVLSEMATSLEIYTGKVGDIIENVEFTKINIPEKEYFDEYGDLKEVGGEDYEYLSMNYILVPDQSKDEDGVEDGAKKYMMNNAHLYLYAGTETEPINDFVIPNVPVQRNWRTNIVGDIMNNNVTFNIVIDPTFNKDDNGDDHNYYANVLNEDELRQAIAHGAVVTLKSDIDVTAPMTVNKNVILNLDGKTLNITMDDILFRVNGSLEINGQGGTVKGNDYVASVNAGGTVTVNGGNYEVDDVTLFQANGGKVYITDGIFKATGETPDGKKNVYVLNHIDTEKANGLIEVSGGMFVGYDPMNSASENPAMNFVKAGMETVNVGGNYIVRTVGAAAVLPVDVTTTASVAVAAGETFDGNGKTLRMEKNDANGYILPKGGIVKNVNIDGYNTRNANDKVLYGIYILNATEDVLIENVNVSGVAYPLNASGATVDGLKLTVKNSTLYGWTSFAVFSSAEFTSVNFRKSNYDYAPSTADPTWFASFKPYCATTLTDCTFEEGFVLDLSKLATGAKVKFVGCKVGEVEVTAANVEELLGVAYDAEKMEF